MARSAPWLVPLVAILALNGCADDGGQPPGATATPTPSLPASFTATVAPTATSTLLPTPPPSATLAATPTATSTPVPATSTPTATPTATPTDSGCCGDATIDPDEGCDDGNQVGGDGCAANCTLESLAALPLHGTTTIQASSFAVAIEFDSMQNVRLGSPTLAGASRPCGSGPEFAAGEIPLAQRASDLSFDPAPVPGLVCACVRAVEIERCGPALVRRSGTDCSAGEDCRGDASLCGDEAECRSAHGAGNASSGVIGCAGLDDVDFESHLDGETGEAVCTRSGGRAPSGSAFIYATTMIGTIMDSGTCSEDTGNAAKGDDGVPCTDDDPAESRGLAMTAPLTTGIAGGGIFYAGGAKPPIQAGSSCGSAPCQTVVVGRPFSCENLPGDPRLCTAFNSLAQPTAGDIVTTTCYELHAGEIGPGRGPRRQRD